MKISLITITYNSEKYLRYTFDSILSQTYKNIEYIVIDGHSTDSTLDIIKEYEPLFRGKMKWLSEPDRGIYDAMNKGVRLTIGDIIGILNSDDIYSNNKVIATVASRFASNPNLDAVYGDLIYVDAENINRIIRYWKSGIYKDGAFNQGWMPPHPSLFVKKIVYDKYGVFDTRFKSAGDYEFMLRIIHKKKINISYLKSILVKMRLGGESNVSLRNRIRGNLEDRMAWKINEINPSLLTFYLKPLRKVFQYIARP